MLPLYGLPRLPETKPKSKGYSVGLLTMYTYSRYSSNPMIISTAIHGPRPSVASLVVDLKAS